MSEESKQSDNSVSAASHCDDAMMTYAEAKQRFDNLPEGIADVIEAIMLMLETMQKHPDTVTIGALMEGLELAMADGHEIAEVYLGMVLIALREAKAAKSA